MATPRKITPEIESWLTEHINDGTYEELSGMVAREFGVDVFPGTLRKHANQLKLVKVNSSRSAVWGNIKTATVGSERVIDGIVWVKIAAERGVRNKKNPGGFTNGHNWRKKAYINYEQAHGEIPTGKRLVYLDGNSENCNADNLYFTTVGIQMHIARHGILRLGNRDLTLAAIKRYELDATIKRFFNKEVHRERVH